MAIDEQVCTVLSMKL